ncbi:MAG: GNAT family N-acetyltransferase [Ignavibacteriaceae bacterium]
MQNNIKIRQADISDIEFVLTAIIESEKSGTDKLSYTRIFPLSEAEVRTIIGNALKENIPGQQYSISNFLIALIDGNYAGACCSWIEGETGLSSSIIMANLLIDFIDHDNFTDSQRFLKIATEVVFTRTIGAIQIENVYVDDKFRGKGISSFLIQKHIENLKDKAPTQVVQIILAKTNENAFRSYIKSGFEIVAERSSENKEILDILPSDTNILMEKRLN